VHQGRVASGGDAKGRGGNGESKGGAVVGLVGSPTAKVAAARGQWPSPVPTHFPGPPHHVHPLYPQMEDRRAVVMAPARGAGAVADGQAMGEGAAGKVGGRFKKITLRVSLASQRFSRPKSRCDARFGMRDAVRLGRLPLNQARSIKALVRGRSAGNVHPSAASSLSGTRVTPSGECGGSLVVQTFGLVDGECFCPSNAALHAGQPRTRLLHARPGPSGPPS
jgi:hypothetical protein